MEYIYLFATIKYSHPEEIAVRDVALAKVRPGLPSNFDDQICVKDVPSSKLRLERSQSRIETNVSRVWG